MEYNPVGWFEIYVDDMDRARAFYQAVLGCQLQQLPNTDMEMWAFPMLEGVQGAAGALARMEGAPVGQNSTLVYFSCQDCAEEEARVESAGGSVERGKFQIGEYGFVSLVKDTEGNVIGLHSLQ